MIIKGRRRGKQDWIGIPERKTKGNGEKGP